MLAGTFRNVFEFELNINQMETNPKLKGVLYENGQMASHIEQRGSVYAVMSFKS